MNGKRITDQIKSKFHFICLIGQNDERSKSIKGKELCDACFPCTEVPNCLQPFVCVDGIQGGQEDTQMEGEKHYGNMMTPGNTDAISSMALTESVDINLSKKNVGNPGI